MWQVLAVVSTRFHFSFGIIAGHMTVNSEGFCVESHIVPIRQTLECTAQGGVIAIIGLLLDASPKDMSDVASLGLSQGCIVRGINVGSKQLMEISSDFC